MKKIFNIYYLVIILSITLIACGKKDDGVTPVTPSTWNVLGDNFKATSTIRLGNDTLYASDTLSLNGINGVEIFFGKTPVSGTYDIVAPKPVAVIAPNQCGIGIIYDFLYIYSVSGGSLNVTIKNNKITAVFNNIDMSKETNFSINTGYSFAPFGTASGVIIEQ